MDITLKTALRGWKEDGSAINTGIHEVQHQPLEDVPKITILKKDLNPMPTSIRVFRPISRKQRLIIRAKLRAMRRRDKRRPQ